MTITDLFNYKVCPICNGNLNHDTMDMYCVKDYDYRVDLNLTQIIIWLSPQVNTAHQWSSSRVVINKVSDKHIFIGYRIPNTNQSLMPLPLSLIEESIDIKDFIKNINVHASRIEKLKSFF